MDPGEVDDAQMRGLALQQHGQQILPGPAVGQPACRLGQDMPRRVQHLAQLRGSRGVVLRRNAPAVLHKCGE